MKEDLSNLNSLGLSLEHQPSIILTFSPSILCTSNYYLKSLDRFKACGPDRLPAFPLICYAEEIPLHFHIYLINP